ncbi:S9 family peptidase [Oxalobacteraceae sp. CFBP 8763]|nr:S9 family peptidase [Oxalobacteraceae sp. CFBP 8763]
MFPDLVRIGYPCRFSDWCEYCVKSKHGWRRTIARCVLCVAAAFGFVASATAQTQAALPPVESFFENDAFGGAVLSPDGTFLAVRLSKPGRRDFLAVVELATRAAKVVAEYRDADVADFQWVNDRRLVYNLRDSTDNYASYDYGPGLYAVDRDGERKKQLAARNHGQNAPQPWNTLLMSQAGSQNSDWLYVERPMFDKNNKYFGTRLRRINTVTGEGEIASEPDVEVSSFMLDAKGEPRLALLNTDLQRTIYYRDDKTDKWRELASYQIYKNLGSEIKPLGFGPDGTLYVIARAGDDLATLRTLDLANGTVSKDALVATAGYDFAGELVQNEKMLGVRFTTDALTNLWFDSTMKALQEAIDKALPRTVNLISVPARPAAPWVLVEAYSDLQPSSYFLYDTKSGQLDPIGQAYPRIDPAGMGRQRAIQFKARDGLDMSGLLTLPAGGASKNLPMVVLVHGGPWARGSSWGWDPQSQFLASRGYAVLEVEFRGSTGFGAKHFEAGLKQWGLAMQNDLADGTRWAIGQGIADPQRICIAGASYGGYAALMGLINDPSLYRCAINWLGVTDIKLMFTGTWFSKSDLSEASLQYGMPVLIGDIKKDAAQLQATSPIQQAARIHQPVLLAYGGEDKRVPIHHGKQFYSAVKKHNSQVEWVEYSEEGHGWRLPENRIDFWGRVERFLGKHIGSRAPVAAASK